MLTINKIIPGGRGLAPALLRRAAFVELDWDVRQRSRFEAVDSAGTSLGVFLPRGAVVRGGDVLVAEDGSLRPVRAAPQPVLVVRACPEHGSAHDLLRAAYHLGNRHVALEVAPDHLKLEPDPVLADMLRRRHLIVEETRAAFEPEAGAYLPDGHGGAGPAGAVGHAHSPVDAQGHGPHGHRHDVSPDSPRHAEGRGHAHVHASGLEPASDDHADWHAQGPVPGRAPSDPHGHGVDPGHDQAGGHHDIPPGGPPPSGRAP
jgi:urease accessory protein